jgi:NADPH:quinone reductase-like Zn-dependent oxidoreductase
MTFFSLALDWLTKERASLFLRAPQLAASFVSSNNRCDVGCWGTKRIPVLKMIRKMPTVKGYSVRLVTGDDARRKVAVEYVAKGLASGALRPIIDRTFKFDDMVEVHRYLENSGQFGKIVVTV